jgi:hypothetical protein
VLALKRRAQRMAIENRNLEAGTRLVGRHKGKVTVCLVEAGEEGSVVFRLEGESKTYKSLSSAATTITKGAINGWKFWSLEGDPPITPERTTKPAARKASGKKVGRANRGRAPQAKTKLIYQLENQDDVPEGQARYWCNACMESFLTFEEPTQCPNGHRVDDPELTATADAAEAEAD